MLFYDEKTKFYRAIRGNSNELTPREIDIIKLVCKGFSNKEIAERLYISISTVQTHIITIMQKFYISDQRRDNKNVKRLRMALVYLREHKELLESEE